MIQFQNVHTLTDFLRHAKAHLKRLHEGGPLVLTVNGRVAAVVDSPDSYRQLLAARERIDANESIRRGLASEDRGDGRSAKTVLAKIRRKHRVPSSR